MTVNGPQSEISNSGTATQLPPLSGDVGAAHAVPGLVPDQPAEPVVERATPGVFDNIPPNAGIAVCCSGGGIRSAAFNLGALQSLQECDDVYSKVRTITAVSGGSYIAAAHAIAELDLRGSAAGGGKAFALRSPEETHLRDRTRYLVETWQVTLSGLLQLGRGVLTNLVLLGALLYVGAHLLGWLLRGTGILTGLSVEQPRVHLGWYVTIPCALALVTTVLGLRSNRQPATGGAVPPLRRHGSVSILSIAAVGTVLSGLLLVGAPYALQGMYDVGRQDSQAGAVVRILGFSSGSGCRALVTGATAPDGSSPTAPSAGCGAQRGQGGKASANGSAGTHTTDRIVGLAGLFSTLMLLIRTVMGRLRTFEKDLRGYGATGRLVQTAGAWLRDRLLPWLGASLVTVAAALLGLRWTGVAVAMPYAHGSAWMWSITTTGYAVGVLLLIKLGVDINQTSLHAFYRQRLAAAYAVARSKAPRKGSTAPDGSVRSTADTKLSNLHGHTPELVVCAAANCNDVGALPPGRGCVSFTFTPTTVGLSTSADAAGSGGGQRIATRTFEQRCGIGPRQGTKHFTVFDAVAVSGAAVAPVMGKVTRPSLRLLFTLGNVRLGLWLRPPWWLSQHAPTKGAEPASAVGRVWRELLRRLQQPDCTRLYAEAFGRLHVDDRWIYVTDGGHYENLGLIEALRRRPDLVIVLDASADRPGRFAALGQAVALARTECGVEVQIDPTPISPTTDRLSSTACVSGTFRYPDDPDTPHPIVYAKLVVPADAPWDVKAYQQSYDTFPTDSTLQQLYGADEFEAYRALGNSTADSLLNVAPQKTPATALHP